MTRWLSSSLSVFDLGHVIAFLVMAPVLVVGLGVGLPNTYWHRLAYLQILEGPDRVVIFIEVERAMEWPALIGVAPHNYAAAFFRIDVFPDGRVERTELRYNLRKHLTFNTNLYVIVRLADGFYLVENSSPAPRPAYFLGLDRINPLVPEEVIRATGTDVLHASDDQFDLSELDSISAKRGWHRLNRETGGGPYLLYSDQIESTQHGVWLRSEGDWRNTSPESIIAESTSATNHWMRTLIEVDTRRWRSYWSPESYAYRRPHQAASSAR